MSIDLNNDTYIDTNIDKEIRFQIEYNLTSTYFLYFSYFIYISAVISTIFFMIIIKPFGTYKSKRSLAREILELLKTHVGYINGNIKVRLYDVIIIIISFYMYLLYGKLKISFYIYIYIILISQGLKLQLDEFSAMNKLANQDNNLKLAKTTQKALIKNDMWLTTLIIIELTAVYKIAFLFEE